MAKSFHALPAQIQIERLKIQWKEQESWTQADLGLNPVSQSHVTSKWQTGGQNEIGWL